MTTIDARETEATALAELVSCETLSQTAAWVARWSAAMADADGALLWVPHFANPTFLCVGTQGEGTRALARRTARRDQGLAHDLIRDHVALTISPADFPHDELIVDLPEFARSVVAVPLDADKAVIGILILLFAEDVDADERLELLDPFLQHAIPALSRALRAEKKNVGMLHAIERLTNLYDVSKAFTSTIDLAELSEIIVRKAADFASAEVASLWMLDRAAGDVLLAATAVNERYGVPDPPSAVGSSVVGDVLADQQTILTNDAELDEDGYPIRTLLAIPLIEDEVAVGALVLVNKHGKYPDFTSADEELLTDVTRQAVRALHNARLYEAEKKIEELDALLAVSQEITATLDLGRVLKTVVNAASAIITYDRCAIAIQQHGALKLGAVSGMLEIDRKDPATRRLEELLHWVFLSGNDLAVTRQENGDILTDRPETEEKFKAYFDDSGMRSIYAVVLHDEEGKLGVLSFESSQPLIFDDETRDLLQILRNQATLAVRNAQLYQQVPLVGFWKPLMEKRRKFGALEQPRRRAWAIGIASAILLLVVLPWRVRVDGTARVLPARRIAVTAPVAGVVREVHKREGDTVKQGDLIASLRDDAYQASLSEARSALQIAQSEVARYRVAGDAPNMFQSQSRRDELLAKIGLAEEQLARTQIRAAAAGVILTPRIEERVGQFLDTGAELGIIGDTSDVTVEVAIPEAEAALLRMDQPVALKIHPYPTRTWRGRVTRVGAVVHEEDDERFVIVESRVANPDGSLRAGMLGRGKINVGTRRMISAMFRKPVRYLWMKIWPLLP
jgi:RND family efflux transporter MFP subunit